MKVVLVLLETSKLASMEIPWHFGFFKDILVSQGHQVDIIDNQARRLTLKKTLEIIVENDYDLIGSGGIGVVYGQMKALFTEVKKLKPGIFTVAGGHILGDLDFILRDIPIDIAVTGEGEITLPKIVNILSEEKDWRQINGIAYLDGDRVIRNSKERLVKLDDLPDHNLNNFNIGEYDTSVPDSYLIDDKAKELKKNGSRYLHMYPARGCTGACFFCYRHVPGYRHYSQEKLEKVLQYFTGQGFNFIHFGDECITADKRNLRKICELTKKYNIYWGGSGRVDQLTEDDFKMLKKHNCVVMLFGVESFDNDILKTMKKHTIARQNIEAMRLCYKYGIITTLQLVLGAPGENRKTLFNTRKYMWKCHLALDKIASAILNPYPGSPAYLYASEHGLIKDKAELHRKFSDKGEITVNLSELSDIELKAWQMWINCEAAVSYRIKHKTLLIDRNFLSKFKQFGKHYLSLLKEPANFFMFNIYLLRGFTYWFLPVSKPFVEK